MTVVCAQRPSSEFMLIVSCGLIGAVFDSALVAAGWVTFPSGMVSESMAPYWIVTMWMLFGTTINLSMRWMRGRPWLASAFAFVGGPLAYFGGHKIGRDENNRKRPMPSIGPELGIGYVLGDHFDEQVLLIKAAICAMPEFKEYVRLAKTAHC